MQQRSIVIASLALCGAAVAQTRTYVNPTANAAVEGASRITFPFGGKAAMHFQQMLGLSGDLTTAGTLSQVAFRRDNDTIVASLDYAAWNPVVDLTVSTSPRTTLTMSKTFANNVGTDARLVFSGTLNWPAQKKVPPGPTPFAYAIPFSTPFVYLPVRGDLLLDIVHKSSDNPNTLCFMDADASAVGSRSLLQGPGCPTGSNAVVVYDNWGPGATARILLWKATSITPSILSIGARGDKWGPFILPLDLAPLGAPGCKIYNDNVFWLPGTTAGGRWDVTFEIPNIPALGGTKVYVQFYQPGDTGANNPAKLSTSDGYEITLAVPAKGTPPQSEAHSSSLTDASAALLQQGYGPVVELSYR